MGILSYEEKFENIKGGKAGLAMNLLEGSSSRDSVENGEVIITVSASPVIKLLEGNTYIGSLQHSTSMKIYQVDETLLAKPGYLMVDFTPCIGAPDYDFIENPSHPSKVMEENKFSFFMSQYRHGRIYKFLQLPRDKLFIVVK